MDLTNSKLADLILSSGDLPATWNDEPLFHQCLSELTACSLDRLTLEPDHLRQSHLGLTEQNRALAAANYTTFIQTAECSRGILADFRAVESGTEKVGNFIPGLTVSCEKFLTAAHTITDQAKMNSITLAKHTQVLELLEIPQLMETCVRNAYYDEALELVTYAKRLERKHNQLEIVMKIVREVRSATQHLLNQLVQQLKGDLQLPACLKVIGYLRRMDVFSEPELRLKFLQCRDSWLQNLLKGVPRDDPYQYATKMVEISRVHLFDIITQYRAVFSDEDPIMSLRDSNSGTPNDSSLFHSWLVLKISGFLTTLARQLDRMSTDVIDSGQPGTALASSSAMAGRYQSLLAQSMYFGLSFSRVGCDFRPHLAEIFNNAIYAHFQRCLSLGIADFTASIPVLSLSLLASSSQTAPSNPSSLLASAEEVAPPHALLDYPLLALLCNHILQALNNLRIVCAANILPLVTSSLTACLQSSAQALAAYHVSERDHLSTREEEALCQLSTAFAHHLVPHINLCLSHLVTAARVPGQTQAKSQASFKRRHIPSWQTVSSKLVLSPLQDLLPAEVPVEEAVAEELDDLDVENEVLPSSHQIEEASAPLPEVTETFEEELEAAEEQNENNIESHDTPSINVESLADNTESLVEEHSVDIASPMPPSPEPRSYLSGMIVSDSAVPQSMQEEEEEQSDDVTPLVHEGPLVEGSEPADTQEGNS